MSPDWLEQAACRGVDVNVFYPSDADKNPSCYKEARRLCAGCPVIAPCLADALATEPARSWRFGMRGGLTPKERNRIAHAPEKPLCEVCLHPIVGRGNGAKTCSARCAKIREARYMRAWQRQYRNNGKPNPIGKHGGIRMAQSGCKCFACKNRRRHERREQRLRAELRDSGIGGAGGVMGTRAEWPYKVVAYEPGAAEVRERATGEVLGYVLQNFHGDWTPYRQGHRLSEPVRLRAAAARHVWETRP